jgi:hypothetical protein
LHDILQWYIVLIWVTRCIHKVYNRKIQLKLAAFHSDGWMIQTIYKKNLCNLLRKSKKYYRATWSTYTATYDMFSFNFLIDSEWKSL